MIICYTHFDFKFNYSITMIIFDNVNKAVTSNLVGKKSVRDKNDRTKFSANKKLSDANTTSDAKDVADIAPMLFLQEFDVYQQDKENIEQFASKAFKALKELQRALIIGGLSQRHLINLQNTLDSNKHKFSTLELESLANEIAVRVAVEIAKLEIVSDKKLQ